jgi:O-antigen/teichoic acid export membrane protein
MISPTVVVAAPPLGGRLRSVAAALLGRASPLVLARLGSAAITFVLPLALARLLTPDQFGTYKQFFLVAQTLLLTAQLGLTQSLYYFLPRGGAERGTFVTQALASLLALGVAVAVGLYAIAPSVARWMGDPSLVIQRAPLAVFAGAMLAAAPLEGALTSESRIGAAALAYVVSDATRAAALGGAALAWGGTAVFWAAAAFALLRVAALAALVAARVLPTARPRLAMLKQQLAFALPFAGAIWLYVGQRYFAQYAVAAHFPPATFALFAVAAFHLPVVDIVFTPISEVMMVQIGAVGAADPAAARAHWHDAVRKLATLLFPATFGSWLLGPTLLPLLFTHKYDGAVPLFLLATVEIPLWVLPCDALLRAGGDTRFLFGFNAARVGVTAGCVLGGMHVFGLPGAIAGGIASEAVARVVMLLRGRRFIDGDGDGGAGALVDAASLGRIAAAAALACAPTAALRWVLPPGVSLVLASVAVYGLAYLALRLSFAPRGR